MRIREKIVFIFLLVLVGIVELFPCGANMENIESDPEALIPIQKQINKLTISFDPRLELLGAIQGCSNYPHIQRNTFYYDAVQTYFASFTTMPAVSLTNALTQMGFSYEIPVNFILHLTPPNECTPYLPYPDYLVNRAGTEENLVNYQKAIHEFAVKSRFGQFWKQHESLYREMVDDTISELSGIDCIAALENYFNESHTGYTIILSPLLKGGYGASLITKNGKKDLYACLPLEWRRKDSVHSLKRSSLLYYLWHEFSHSFVNQEVEKYPEIVDRTSGLFLPLKEQMRKQTYGTWKTCIDEHIVRAVTIRITELYIGKREAHQILNNELNNHFLYMDPLLEKLKEYENKVKKEKITFSEFVPELLRVFDSIPETYYKSPLPFSGPINNVFLVNKKVIIYPTNSLNKEELAVTKEYAESIHSRFFNRDLLLPDTVALKTDLSDYGLIVYGTIESNLFLKKYESLLPFQIKEDRIIADREYTEPNLKFISCLPNPQNRARGMVIYTATSNKDIPAINNVFHGPEDYILFIDREHIIKKGYYNKAGTWTF